MKLRFLQWLERFLFPLAEFEVRLETVYARIAAGFDVPDEVEGSTWGGLWPKSHWDSLMFQWNYFWSWVLLREDSYGWRRYKWRKSR